MGLPNMQKGEYIVNYILATCGKETDSKMIFEGGFFMSTRYELCLIRAGIWIYNLENPANGRERRVNP